MLTTISSYIGTLEQIYSYMLIGYVLLSWMPNARDSFIGQWLGKLVEPYLSIFRRFIPPIGGMLDISPIIALFALKFIALGIVFVLDIFL
ncbi:YggT family protein [Paenibacillus sp. MMS18-CY102]|uniref:YggT family protein n=1 Tax=Paenibacillus sp. MMS18-CY102 TaxID=2682849 RepID=UPI001365A6D6|nr:YggT family protein [Paenibacillus sp. MMS18-CY102]MWC27424.1 YggT family protein [Paenibacillus sp. MMS18-CY102]